MAQMLRSAEVATGDSALGFDVVLTEADGGPAIDCTEGTLTVDVEMAKANGAGYDKVSRDRVKVRCERSVGPDIALVVDNSGSEVGTLEQVREASGRLMDLVEKANGRVSLVRVSTEARVLEPLTGDTVTINSTVGVRSIALGRATCALGRAIYDVPGLAWRGGLDAFWREAPPPDPELVEAFIRAIAACLHVRGVFYARPGLDAAVAATVRRLHLGVLAVGLGLLQ